MILKTLTLAAALVALTGIAAPAAAQEGGPGFDIAHDHIGISVPDLDASVAWYKEMFGFEEVLRFEEPQVPMTVAHIQRGDVYIELFEVENANKLPDYRRGATSDLRTHGIKHFAFEVDGLRDIIARLKKKGVEIAMPVRETERTSFAFIRDNAGNTFELIDRKE